MVYYFKALLILSVVLISFRIIGRNTGGKLKIKHSFALEILTGAFVFFAIYNTGYLVCLFLKLGIQGLSIWTALLWLGFAFCCRRELAGFKDLQIKKISREYVLYYSAALLAFALLFYYGIRFCYYGWDTASYIKEISRAVEHGTLYKDWVANQANDALELKYALCSYYMFLAVLARAASIPAIVTARVVGGGACIVLSAAAVYCLGKELFDDVRDAILVSLLWTCFNFVFVSIYTASAFLMERSYEGKAWCANVIIPFILLAFFHLYKHESEKGWWGCLVFAAFACNTISMSMIIISPIMVTLLSGILWLKERKAFIIYHWMICMLPLTIYCVLLGLELKNILVVMA